MSSEGVRTGPPRDRWTRLRKEGPACGSAFGRLLFVAERGELVGGVGETVRLVF